MRPHGVVEGEIARERGGAPARVVVGMGVGPLPEQGTDEAFRLPVRLRTIRLGEALADAKFPRALREDQGAIAAPVVRQDALHGDALLGVPGDRAFEEPGGRLAALIAEDLPIAEARVIVDGDVGVLITHAPRAAAAIAMDAMPELADAPQLLDIQVDQLPGIVAIVAHDGARWLQPVEPGQADAAHLHDDGRARGARRPPVRCGDCSSASAASAGSAGAGHGATASACAAVARTGRGRRWHDR